MKNQLLLYHSVKNTSGCALNGVAYLFLDNCVSYLAKLVGLLSSKGQEKIIVGDLVKTINEECLHVLINEASPGLRAESHHSVIYELRCAFGIDQYHYHDSQYSRQSRKRLSN